MSQYGDIAILAVELFPDLQDVRDAWQMATEALGQETTLSPALTARNTFLALCDAGKVLGIPAASVPGFSRDGTHTLKVLQQVQNHSSSLSREDLSLQLQQEPGAQQEELDVLFSLWDVGLLSGQFTVDSSQ